MEGIELIKKHFPGLSELQLKQFAMMGELYPEWNANINVISRKDIDNLYPIELDCIPTTYCIRWL